MHTQPSNFNININIFSGSYSSWTHEDTENVNKDHEDYCPKVPFQFAFALLIILWIMLPCTICCSCCACIGKCFNKSSGEEPTETA